MRGCGAGGVGGRGGRLRMRLGAAAATERFCQAVRVRREMTRGDGARSGKPERHALLRRGANAGGDDRGAEGFAQRREPEPCLFSHADLARLERAVGKYARHHDAPPKRSQNAEKRRRTDARNEWRAPCCLNFRNRWKRGVVPGPRELANRIDRGPGMARIRANPCVCTTADISPRAWHHARQLIPIERWISGNGRLAGNCSRRAFAVRLRSANSASIRCSPCPCSIERTDHRLGSAARHRRGLW